jgi:hypothetical protein
MLDFNGNHYFPLFVAELKDCFHMLLFRLTNETLFDIGISERFESRGVIDGERPLEESLYTIWNFPLESYIPM